MTYKCWLCPNIQCSQQWAASRQGRSVPTSGCFARLPRARAVFLAIVDGPNGNWNSKIWKCWNWNWNCKIGIDPALIPYIEWIEMFVAVMFDSKQIFGLDILFSSIFSIFFRKKLEEIAFFQFLPGVLEEIYFFRKKPHPIFFMNIVMHVLVEQWNWLSSKSW